MARLRLADGLARGPPKQDGPAPESRAPAPALTAPATMLAGNGCRHRAAAPGSFQRSKGAVMLLGRRESAIDGCQKPFAPR